MPMSSTDRPEQVIPVLYDADRILAVNKPPGVPCQADRTGDADLLRLMEAQLGASLPGPVHRLDRPVSGVVLLARDAAMLKALSALFRERAVVKHSWAIVEGRMEGGGTLEHALRHDGRAKRSRAVQPGDQADRPTDRGPPVGSRTPCRSPSASRWRAVTA